MEELLKCEILPKDFPTYDLSFPIIFTGEGVGKSVLLQKAIDGIYMKILICQLLVSKFI